LDEAGNWTVRGDVYYQEARVTPGGRGCPLSATANSSGRLKSIGPELGFGYVMGTFHDEQVLLIKTAMGNRSLAFDFRPPSSGRTDPANEFEGLEYRLTVKGVRETLDNIAKIVPGYKGQGYEIAGFGWFQGHKDKDAPKEEYEKHLVNLIHDLRKEFKTPKMRVVVATVGFGGYRIEHGGWKGVWAAQMAVGDPKQHPEFAGTVASVDTRDFWREVEESPKGQDYHYNRNAETYLLVGEAMGRAMVRLEGGVAAAIPKSDREARLAAELAAQAAKPTPTEAQKAASLAALKPMILDGALVGFMNNGQYQTELKSALKGEKPARGTPFLNDALDEAVAYYRAAGINDYDWKPFGGDMKNGKWEYYTFNLPKPQADPKAKFIPVAEVTYPAGMENWFAVNFDAQKAGWKSGAAPFGERADKANLPDFVKHRADKRVPATLCSSDVLLLRQSFEFPPLKEDCRYRIRVGGSAHNNMGEGYAIYINGKLLAESKSGVVAWRKEGNKPRGSHVWPEWRDDFKGRKVTIAVSNFPMHHRPAAGLIPPGDALSVWIEEMKLPPLGQCGE
jgi:alpha-galactosidase